MSIAAQNNHLFDAVKGSNFSRVKSLVKNGIELNELNQQGKTVLDIAVEKETKRLLVTC